MSPLLKSVGAAVLALGTTAAVVAADMTGQTDRKGDTRGRPDAPAGTKGFDLRSASANHSGSKLVHAVVSWNAAKATAVVLELDVGRKPGADFIVLKRRSGGTMVMDTKGKRVAPATFKQISSKSFSLTFGLGFDGNPSSYKWRWRVYGANGTYDLLPNSGWITHKLG